MKTADLYTALSFQPLPYSLIIQSFSNNTKSIHIDGLTLKPFSSTISMQRDDNDNVEGRVVVSIRIPDSMDIINYGIEEDPLTQLSNLPDSIKISLYYQDVELIINAASRAYKKALICDFSHKSVFDAPCSDNNINCATLAMTNANGLNDYERAFDYLKKAFPYYKEDYIFMSVYNGCCRHLQNYGVDYHDLL